VQQQVEYFPHVELLLQALRINRERLNGRSKIAIDAKVLRRLIELAVERLPFSPEFYAATYPDIAAALAAGQIPDLHKHFVETGYFEGRVGAPPSVDETYYRDLYRDVSQAVERGDVESAQAHYMRSGAAEGRVPSADLQPEVDAWIGILRVAHGAQP
jgi:hypothetical protein